MAARHSRAGRIATVVLPILALTAAVLIGWSMPWQSFIMVGSPVSQAQSGGFIQTLTAPVAANFTQLNYNVGTNVTTTQVNNSTPVTSISIIQNDPNATNEMVALEKNKLASTFTITAGFSMQCGSAGLGGIWLADSSAGPNIIFYTYQCGFGVRASLFTNFTSFAGDLHGAFSSPIPFGPLAWLRVQETASNRIYSISSDGINFAQFGSESNTASLTTTRYGVGVANRGTSGSSTGTMITLYSWTETNP